MEREAIRSAVVATIRSIAPEADLERLAPDRPLREQVALDSMDWLNVVAALSDRLAVEIPAADYEQLATLDAIVAYVAARKAVPIAERPRTASARPGALPRETHVVNGAPVELRPVCREDAELEADFVRRLSSDSRYLRFMVTLAELSPAKVASLTDVDQVRHVALAATAERDGKPELAGVARYIVDDAGTGCEFAVEVGDAWHGTGLAGILMGALIEVARVRGLGRMEGYVLAANHPMRKFMHQLGFEAHAMPDAPDTLRFVRTL
jgi:acyl carrier protein/RimJ/RimL family protein N-acetyltransferase